MFIWDKLVWNTDYSVVKNSLTKICREIIKIRFILWMNCTYNVTGLSGKLKRWVEKSLLYVADQNHYRGEIVVDQSSKSEDIYLMVNSLLTDYNTKNRATLQKLPNKSLISGIKKKKLLFGFERRKVKN